MTTLSSGECRWRSEKPVLVFGGKFGQVETVVLAVDQGCCGEFLLLLVVLGRMLRTYHVLEGNTGWVGSKVEICKNIR